VFSAVEIGGNQNFLCFLLCAHLDCILKQLELNAICGARTCGGPQAECSVRSYLNRDLGRLFLSRALFCSLQIQYKLQCSIYPLSPPSFSRLFWVLFYRNSFHPPNPHPTPLQLLRCSHITLGRCVQHSLTHPRDRTFIQVMEPKTRKIFRTTSNCTRGGHNLTVKRYKL